MEKINLVLDLDHTLLQTKTVPLNAISGDEKTPSIGYDNKFVINNENSSDDSKSQVYVRLRPGLKAFLTFAADNFNCFVFTNGHRRYAEELVKIIDPSGTIFGGKIISRDPNPSKSYYEARLLEKGLSLHELLTCNEHNIISRLMKNDLSALDEVSKLGIRDIIEDTFFDEPKNPYDASNRDLCIRKKIYPCIGKPENVIIVDNDADVWENKENLILVEPFYPYENDKTIPSSLLKTALDDIKKSEKAYLFGSRPYLNALDALKEKLLCIKRAYELKSEEGDIRDIIHRNKMSTFAGMTLYIPKLNNVFDDMCKSHGAKVHTSFIPGETTHIITSSLRDLEERYKASIKGTKGPIVVTPLWLVDSIKSWRAVPTDNYLVIDVDEKVLYEIKTLEKDIKTLEDLGKEITHITRNTQKRTNWPSTYQPPQKKTPQAKF